ncbi:MAG: hypothetical protein K8S24_10060 [Candidatus Aegiribacteria sp.]|nr:hypothetical protein [Candidatus Aegiribacteria sp.]
MKYRSLISITAVMSILILQAFTSCAVNRVIYNEQMEIDGFLVRVVVLDSSDLKELVISMQNPGQPIRERVFYVNWIPELLEVDDYNSDSRLDLLIISTSDEKHYFYSTEMGIVDII